MNSKIVGILAVYVISLAVASQLCDGAVDFRDIYKLAIQLEKSAKALAKGGSEAASMDVTDQERRIAKAFLKPTKPELVNKHLFKVDAMINDIRGKTIAIYHSIQGNDLFGGMKRGMMMNSIKGYASFDNDIAGYADGLNWKISKNTLNEEEISCAMENLKSRHQQVVLLVLRTELKNLVLNEIGLVNDAILTQLKDQKLQTNNAFYNNLSLTDKQTEALRQFYLAHRDVEVSDAEDYLDHVINPGQLIIGRLMEACSSVNDIYDKWTRVLTRQETCPKEVTVFKTAFMPRENVDTIKKFCSDFMSA